MIGKRYFGAALLLFALTPAIAQEQGNPIPPDVQNSGSAKADALFYDATKARIRGDDQQAEDLLLQLVKLKPAEPALYYDLARISQKKSNTQKAFDYMQKAVELDGNNKYYQEEYAVLQAQKGQYAQAAETMSKLAGKERFNEEYLLRAAFWYQRAGKNQESLKQFDKLLEKDAGNEDILLQKQALYLKMDDVPGAVGVLNQLITQNPREPRYYALLAELYQNTKQQDKALELYTKAQKLFPEDPSIQLGLADYFRKNKDTARYNEYVQKAIVNKELEAESQLALLLPYLQENGGDSIRRREGIALAQKLAEQHPTNGQVQAFYGDILSINNQRADAAAQYKKAVAVDPSRFQVWQQLLFAYTDRESADSLILYSEKALRLFPNQAMAHYLNGVGYLNKKDYARSIKAINRAIDMQPEENEDLLAQMYTTLGDAYNSNKEYVKSDSSYEAALRLDPKNATVLNNYAYYLSVRGVRLADAEKMSKASLEIRPGEGTFMDTYGWILYKRGDYKGAREYIQKAIDSNPDNADGTLWEHLGDVYYKLNDTDKALENWKKAKQKASDGPFLDKKIQDKKLYE